MYALRESLVIVKEEGLEKFWDRHGKNHNILRTELEKLGFRWVVEPQYRLSQLNSVYQPDKLLKDKGKHRKYILEKYNLVIGAGLGALAGKIWRIGLMGESCNMKNLELLFKAIKDVLIQ